MTRRRIAADIARETAVFAADNIPSYQI